MIPTTSFHRRAPTFGRWRQAEPCLTAARADSKMLQPGYAKTLRCRPAGVPIVELADLTEMQVRALRITDNRIDLNGRSVPSTSILVRRSVL